MSVAVNVWSIGDGIDGDKARKVKGELEKIFADSPSGTTVDLTGSQGSATPLVFKITDANGDEKFWHEIDTSKTGSTAEKIIAEIKKAVKK